MGYTRYWQRTERKMTAEFTNKVKEIVADCEAKGIHIRGGFGISVPIITPNTVWLNGDGEKDHCLNHESFCLTNDKEDQGYGFCKTARKPNDYAVREILKVAEINGLVTDVSDDGENNNIISDEDWLNGKW